MMLMIKDGINPEVETFVKLSKIYLVTDVCKFNPYGKIAHKHKDSTIFFFSFKVEGIEDYISLDFSTKEEAIKYRLYLIDLIQSQNNITSKN